MQSDREEQTPNLSHGLNISTLFSLFTNEISEGNEVKPSVYQREVGLDLQKRLKQVHSISKYHDYFKSSSGGDFTDYFDLVPSILIFQNWEVMNQYSSSISIRNKTNKIRYISLSLEQSDTFSVKPSKVIKLPSLSCLTYEIKFCPMNAVDLTMKITFYSESSFYNYQIIAIAQRATIDFPDLIDFGKVLVNFTCVRSFPLHNKSSVICTAQIHLLNQNINVEPQHLIIRPKETILLKIMFRSSVLGPNEEKMIIEYSTGEKMFVLIQVNVINGNIYFNEEELEIKDTFITMKELGSLILYNKTEYSIDFEWDHNTEDDEPFLIRVQDFVEEEGTIKSGKQDYDIELLKRNKSEGNWIDVDPDLCRIGNSTFWQNFTILPMEGVVSRDSALKFIISFHPVTVGRVDSTVFLKVGGMKDRLPVRISGTSRGPDIYLSVDILDILDIYINDDNIYQIFARNIGLIRGTLHSLPRNVSDDNHIVTVQSKEITLLPNEVSTIDINVTSKVVGPFVVEIRFQIVESGSIIKFLLKGNTVHPTITFDVDSIDFGRIPIGVCCEKSFYITNLSSVNVDFELYVPDDGFEDSITVDQLIEDGMNCVPRLYPKEFSFQPQLETVHGETSVKIKVFLVANEAKDFFSDLLVVLNVQSMEHFKIPLKFTAISPALSCYPRELYCPFYFLGLDNEHELTLFNDDEVQLAYWLLEYEDEDFKCFVKEGKTGVIESHGSKQIVVCINAKIIEFQRYTVTAYVLGNSLCSLCNLRIKGNGPVPDVKPTRMAWETTLILDSSYQTVTVDNWSPIPAEFLIYIEKHPQLWLISKEKGLLQPNEKFEFNVMPNAIDEGQLKDNLVIDVKDSRIITIPLEAFARGSSIKFSPSLFPLLDFGITFR